MNKSTMRHLDECFKKAAEDMEELQRDPQKQEELRRTIAKIKHRSAMYIAKLMEGQRQTYNLYRHKTYIG